MEAFITLMAVRYGLSETEIPHFIEDMRWVRRHRSLSEKLTFGAIGTLLAMVVAALGAALFEGVRYFIRKGP